jgi:HPt (histidine-containing phosphotransfer) domain-containing protein
VAADAVETATAATEAIDRNVFDGLATTMGSAFVAELSDTFLADGRELLVTLRRALAQGDIDLFRRAAHSLKSSSETLGAMEVGALARDLEAIARTGSLEGTEARMERLARRYELVVQALGEIQRGR